MLVLKQLHLDRWIRKPWLVIVTLLVAAGLFSLGYRVITGRSLATAFRGMPSRLNHQVRAVLASGSVKRYNQGNYTSIFFLHHSVGRNLLSDGRIRETLNQDGYFLWDQDYNEYDVTGPDGQSTGWSYEVPGDNTDPDGLAAIFQQPLYPLPVNTLSGMLQHEVIVFKSCYSASVIQSDDQLEEYKQYYLKIRAFVDQHPDKLFILLTQPPLSPASTDPAMAARARELASWLISPEYTSGHTNLSVYNFFDQLAEGDPQAPDYNMLKKANRAAGDDHPTQLANEKAAPLIIDFIKNRIAWFRDYRLSE